MIALRRSLVVLAVLAVFQATVVHADDGCGGGGTPPGGTRPQSPEFIVTYGPAATGSAAARTAALAATARAQGANVTRIRLMALDSELVRIDAATPGAVRAAAERLAARPDVSSITVNHTVHAFAAPNDTHYSDQWALHDTAAGISAESAWSAGTGEGAVVAVIDTGVILHADLVGKLVPGWDIVSDPANAMDGNGRDPDATDPGDGVVSACGSYTSSWHGTRVAGIAAAATGNAKGVAGVAPGARIMPVRVLGRGGEGTLSDMIDGIVWAAGGAVPGATTLANEGLLPDVINLSMGFEGEACPPAVQAAIDYATGKGIVVVAAAGNDNREPVDVTPASCAGVITVAASDRDGKRAIYSYGRFGSVLSASNFGPMIDITAPGQDTRSTGNDGATVRTTDNYANFRGTSAAAPHVSGVVALMQASRPQTPAAVLATLQSTAKPAPACDGCGPGIVDAAGALATLSNAPPRAVIHVSISPFSDECSSSSQYNLRNVSIDDRTASYDMDVLWTFADGSTSTNPLGVFVTTAQTVTLRVTDGGGLSSSTSVTLDPLSCRKK